MCGIAGEADFAGHGGPSRELLGRMGDLLAHRGPDQSGFYDDETCGLAFRRLAILDLSPRGHQPMTNEDGSLQLVFNGEVYNFEALRRQLADRHEFRSDTDSEVILHLYEERGPACVEALRGMYAFAIWDTKRQQLFLARDRVGKKPLYYAWNDGRFLFASELRALLPGFDQMPQVDEEALRTYLTLGYIPAPRSALQGIHKLPPGHVATVDQDGVRLRRYWRLEYPGSTPVGDASARFMELFDEAVRLRLRSDVPLGAFLSGGIDSSAVVAVARRHVDRFHTFSVHFPDPAFDESEYAELVAQQLGTDHHRIDCSPDDLDDLTAIAWHHGEPFADSSAVPTGVVSRFARQRVTVVLTGDGGDENFAGYDRYTAILQSQKLRRVPRSARHALRSLIAPFSHNGGPKSRIRLARRFLEIADGTAEDQYRGLVSVFPDRDLDDGPAPPAVDTIHASFEAPLPLLHRMLRTDVETYLPYDLLAKVDIATMAHGLEARAPFLDHPLMEFVASLPPGAKARGLRKKVLLRKALHNVLPDSILNRRKMGFGIPIGRWLRRERSDILDRLSGDPGAANVRLLGKDRIRQLVASHLNGPTDRSTQLWALLVLREWEALYEGGRLSAPLSRGAAMEIRA